MNAQDWDTPVDPWEQRVRELEKEAELTICEQAAPELLAALKACLHALNMAYEHDCGTSVFGSGHNDALDAIDQAENAIANAELRQEA